MTADFHFLRPGWLLLTPLLVWLWWLGHSKNDPLHGWRRIIAPELLTALSVGNRSRHRWENAVSFAGWLLATVSLAGPTWHRAPSPFADAPVPVMLLLKADRSMLATDLPPSRMERARLKIADLAEERSGQPLGFIAYAGSAHLVLPPTQDTSIVATMAGEIDPDIMPAPGDDLVAALELAARTLGDDGGSIVLVTDAIDAAQADALAEFHRERRIPVLVLGVVRPESSELDRLRRAARSLRAKVRPISAGSEDVSWLTRTVARGPVSFREDDGGVAWAESGWWLVPVVALLSLASFRRRESRSLHEVATP